MKKWTRFLCCVALIGLCMACTLTGCATVGNIKNTSSELIYNGNSAVMVDGYLYYGNAFADYTAFTDKGDYDASAKTSYLARVNTNALTATSGDYSPEKVENVSTEVTAHAKDFMFVLGQNIYYATPNTQKATDSDGKTSHYFNYTTIYKSKLNGDSKSKLYTTNGEVSQIEVLKSEGTYYIVMLAGEKLIKINLSNSKSSVIAEGVTSVALPETYQKEKDKLGSMLDWNGYVYYTTALEVESGSGRTGSVVSRVKLSGGESEEIFNQGSTISLIDREKDVVFFTEKVGSLETETYMTDLSTDTSKSGFSNNKTKFTSSSSISDIQLIESEARVLGYVYSTGSTLGYKRNVDGKSGAITIKNGEETLSSYKTLLITGRTAYISTTTAIYKVNLAKVFDGTTETVEAETVVTMTAIYDGTLYAFDGKYVYYYAKLETVDTNDDGKTDDEETDDNYYLYRAKINETNEYQLLGLTKIKSRRS